MNFIFEFFCSFVPYTLMPVDFDKSCSFLFEICILNLTDPAVEEDLHTRRLHNSETLTKEGTNEIQTQYLGSPPLNLPVKNSHMYC